MIDRSHELPLSRQAALLRLGRCSLYYTPRPVPAGELAVMRRIDELHLNYPFAGSRMLRDLLRAEDIVIGREKVAALMRRMELRRCTAGRIRQNPLQATRFTHTCCAAS